MPQRKKCRAFISFDYDNDYDLKNLLVGQARYEDSTFTIADWSIKQASRGWRSEARHRISRSDVVIAICGYHTHKAVGVSAEIELAREVDRPYYLLRGRKHGWVRRPSGTSVWWDPIHPWTWRSLGKITEGGR